jgi:hypothetical protein
MLLVLKESKLALEVFGCLGKFYCANAQLEVGLSRDLGSKELNQNEVTLV